MPKKGSDSKRDYAKYRDYYIGRETSEAGKAKRVERDQSREAMIKAGRIDRDSKMTVDHKKPLSKGGSKGLANLQVMSGTANRKKYT